MASGVLCCENADGNRDNKDHQECDNGDSDGNRNFIADQFSDRHRVRIRGAEISMKKAGYPRSIPADPGPFPFAEPQSAPASPPFQAAILPHLRV